MEPNSKKDGLQAKLENIKLDLDTYKVLLHFQNRKDPLVIHFDKPARRFYFSLISLVVIEMKNLDKPKFIYIRKHEKTLKLLDNSLAGQNASKTVKGMWDKIRKAWRYILPDLESGAHFKILERNLIAPYEKGGKYRYDCSDDECDIWANLFEYDGNNPWRFKFAIDSVSLSSNDISVILGNLKDDSAWQEFVKRLKIRPKTVISEKQTLPRWRKKAAFALVAVSIVVAATSAIWHFYLSSEPSVEVASIKKMAFPLPDKPSIAVLPFDNLSGDSSQDYFSDGITDDLITDISKISGLFVISRNSTFIYKKKLIKIQQVAEDLGVRYVLEGSVRKAGEKVRINAQLIDATTGRHIWADRFDGQLEDIFALQDRFTQKIVAALAVKLTGDDQSLLARRETTSVEAYDAYLRGWDFMRRDTREDLEEAVSSFKKAVELDPGFSRGHTALSLAYNHAIMTGWDEDLGWLDAASLSEKHLKLAMKNPTPLVYREASGKHLYSRNYNKAIIDAEHALALSPNDPENQWAMGRALVFAGRSAEAMAYIKGAIRLNPNYPGRYVSYLGIAQYLMGQYQEAIVSLEKGQILDPDTVSHREYTHWIGAAYAQLGREEEAAKVLGDFLKRLHWYGGFPIESTFGYWPLKESKDLEHLIDGLIKAGMPVPWNPVFRHKYKEALVKAETLLAADPNDPENHILMGQVLNYIGRPAEAIDFIRRAIKLNPSHQAYYLFYLGCAQFFERQFEEAAINLESYHKQNPYGFRMWFLSATYAHLGRQKEAADALKKSIKGREYIDYNVDKVVRYMNCPCKIQKDIKLLAEGLRKAGLPAK